MFAVFVLFNSRIADASPLTVTSYNVESGDAVVSALKKRIRKLASSDLWGFSEVKNESWAKAFAQTLTKATKNQFRYILGTTGGSDRLAIVYNATRLILKEHKEMHPIRLRSYRSPLLAKFFDRSTRKQFFFMVNHLARSRSEKRNRQSKMLNRWAKGQKLAVIAVGDYNYDYNINTNRPNAGFKHLAKGRVFQWVRPKKLVRTQCSVTRRGTCKYNGVLDFVFVAGEAKRWKATSTIIVERGDFPDNKRTSDHRPVQATFYLKSLKALDVVTSNEPEERTKPDILVPLAGKREKIRIGAFNPRVLGMGKMKKPDVVKMLVRIVRRYDLLLMQEIRDKSKKHIKKFHALLNKGLSARNRYKMLFRFGSSKPLTQEHYAYFYKPSVLTPKETYVFDDRKQDIFEREPYIAKFKMRASKRVFSVIGMHAKPLRSRKKGTHPKTTHEEIDGLLAVYKQVRRKLRTPNVIIMGDLNADCTYLKRKALKNNLLRRPSFRWLINDKEDTAVRKSKDCAYDRIIVTGKVSNWIVPGSAKAFRFDKGLRPSFALAVSDHYPVEVSLYLR